jgi:hypothetical protein
MAYAQSGGESGNDCVFASVCASGFCATEKTPKLTPAIRTTFAATLRFTATGYLIVGV